ncbi:MAG: hypothetical protein IT285_16110 [Bdellovibrionales bacterium]|nr:hypothetical protein [Bdellovibrionales bacterium]
MAIRALWWAHRRLHGMPPRAEVEHCIGRSVAAWPTAPAWVEFLPSRRLEAALLYARGGYTLDEIAEATGQTRERVRQLLWSARWRLV